MKYLSLLAILFTTQLAFAQELKTFDCYKHSESMKICIAADSSTYDKVFGFSYRLFHISNPLDSSIIYKQVLNVNYAPDFEYFLNKDFIEEYDIIVVAGVKSFYIYELNEKYLSDQVLIDYTGCVFSDNQGSYIGNFKVLEDGKVLELTIKECGKRHFNITDLNKIYEINTPEN